MYYIMTEKDEITVAMSKFEDVADLIAKNFTETCIIRWSEGNKNNEEHKNFAEALR